MARLTRIARRVLEWLIPEDSHTDDDLLAVAYLVGVVRQPAPHVPSQRRPEPIHPGLRATLSDESLAAVLEQWAGGDRR